jgi:hypothetical protein
MVVEPLDIQALKASRSGCEPGWAAFCFRAAVPWRRCGYLLPLRLAPASLLAWHRKTCPSSCRSSAATMRYSGCIRTGEYPARLCAAIPLSHCTLQVVARPVLKLQSPRLLFVTCCPLQRSGLAGVPPASAPCALCKPTPLCLRLLGCERCEHARPRAMLDAAGLTAWWCPWTHARLGAMHAVSCVLRGAAGGGQRRVPVEARGPAPRRITPPGAAGARRSDQRGIRLGRRWLASCERHVCQHDELHPQPCALLNPESSQAS